MAELVGGAFLSAFFQALFQRLASDEIAKLFCGKKPMVDLLNELNIVLVSANKLLNDAEEKQIKDELVRKWLDELKDEVYRADDLVDTIDSEALRREVEDHQSSSFMSISKVVIKKFTPANLHSGFDFMVKNEASEIIDRLKSLLDQKDGLGLREGVEKSISSSQRPPAPLAEESSVYGRNGDKEAIVDLQLSCCKSDDKITVIPIVGMGGIGKTTLAQLVYDDDRVKEHFDLRAWVTVSDDFDIFKITKVILEKVTLEECYVRDLFELQLRLKEALRGKRFLLVHDDVWNENYHLWDSLKSSFKSGANGSKIIVTTRNMIVSSVMAVGKTPYQLTVLSPEDGLKLFVEHAFGNNVDFLVSQDLQKTCREIVNKCKGVPLAIKALSGLLRCERNHEKWKNVLKSDVWNELHIKEGNTIPALWLSYRQLSTHLKRCFSYCSIFPKDYEFEKEKIIMLWMAEGFLQSGKRDMTMEELGDEYFEELLSRSLFHKSCHSKSIYLMHDLVHDLAIFVAGKFCFRMDESSESHKVTSQTRYLSYSHVPTKLESLYSAKYLRTFIYHGRFPIWNPTHDQLLSTLGRFLKVLCLSNSSIKKLSGSIGNLIHLRYLDVSNCWIEELPDSICCLYNLQTLLLSNCKSLTALPKNMERLINLRHMDIRGVPLREMTFQIKNIKSLQTLNHLLLGNKDSGPKINELKRVQPFRGRLAISRIENVADAKEALEANLKDKKGIRYLSLEWSSESVGDANSSEKEREILDSLQPHTNVTNLVIMCYRGTRFSDWIGHDSYSNIVQICLEKCKSCSILPPLGQLPCLKELWISGLDRLVIVGDELYGNTKTPFRCLKWLNVHDMPQLKEWSFGSKGRAVFPSLDSLALYECPELRTFSPNMEHHALSSAFSSLDSLYVDSSLIVDLLLLELAPRSKLKQLEVKKGKNILHWDLQKLSWLKDLRVFNWDGDLFPDRDGFLSASLTEILIVRCDNLVALNGKAFEELNLLEHLTIQECPKLWCLPEQGLPVSLSYLRILGSPLLAKRCERDKGEDWPKIAHIKHVFVC